MVEIRKIQLPHNKFALVDACDFENLNKHKWKDMTEEECEQWRTFAKRLLEWSQ